MKDKLIVDNIARGWRIVWELEDGDIGADLNPADCKGKAPSSDEERGNWEHHVACETAGTTPEVLKDDRGFYWETEAQARRALRIIKEALKQDRPMPEWAKTALAAGWKPPKGWKA